LGALVRAVVIIFGFIVEVFIFFGGVIIFLVWIFLPLLLVLGLYLGIRLLV